MKIAYFDCFAGIAGDMTLGALLDCGVPLDALREGLSSLPVKGWEIEAQPVLQSGIHGLSVLITLHGQSDEDEASPPLEADAHHDHAHSHSHHDNYDHHNAAHHNKAHSHNHEHHHDEPVHAHSPEHFHDHHSHGADAEHPHDEHHDHGHAHSHGHHHHEDHDQHPHEHGHPHIHGRSMAEIRAIIEASDLAPHVKQTSLKIFSAIAVVEAELHHSTPDEIHFHEIGGVDSLIDICGAAWCLDYLGVEEVYCSALPYSTGYVDCAHGRMPVPAPATLKLLRGAPLFPTNIQGEMITPTGAGIVGTLAKGFGAPPAFTPAEVGFGAGKKQWPDRPNLLRVVIGEKSDSASRESGPGAFGLQSTPQSSKLEGLSWQTLSLLETNIDDMNPEFFDVVFARLFEAGAADVWLQPIQMKKNRPATILSALCPTDKRDAVLTALLRETTTLGVRVSEVQRASLQREIQSVPTRFGPVRVKVARWPGHGLERAAPEYDDVARLAKEHKVAAGEVYQAALAAFSAAGDSIIGTNMTNYGKINPRKNATNGGGLSSDVPFAQSDATLSAAEAQAQSQQIQQ